MSAIPWVGQDIVEFLWGGLKIDGPYYGNIILKILLNAGKSLNLGIVYGFFLILILIIGVKITMTWRQSAGVRSIDTSKASQRLHAGDLILKKKNKNFHTSKSIKLNPNYVTGFSDAEAWFHISILKNKNYKTGYQILPVFSIQLHSKDLFLLEQKKSYFNVGVITIRNNDAVIYSVQSYKDIAHVIVPHLYKYTLLTPKKADYILFKQNIDLINKGKQYLTNKGLAKIISIKACINKGLNLVNLTKEFNVIASFLVQRPEVKLNSALVLNMQWLIGFIEAENCFLCLVINNATHAIGYQVTFSFTLTQHRDLDLMTKIKENLGLGLIYQSCLIVNFTITKKSEINTLTMLHNNLIGAKRLDLKDFMKIQYIIKNGLHKTEIGLYQKQRLREISMHEQMINSKNFKLITEIDILISIYAYIVGLYEGAGFFSITKNGKYLTYELGIELSIRDVQLISKIKNILGIGVISFRTRNGIEMVSLTINNKKHLKNIIIPIFEKYSMFSNKQYDYFRFRDALLLNIIYLNDLPEYTRSNTPIKTIENIINTSYFPAWLVGFIEAKGCFSSYQSKYYTIASFYIAQKDGYILISAIKKYLSFTTAIHKDKTNCYKLIVTGVRSVENIIKFLSNQPVKLMGHKKLQYNLWLKKLRKIPRYSQKINIPFNY